MVVSGTSQFLSFLSSVAFIHSSSSFFALISSSRPFTSPSSSLTQSLTTHDQVDTKIVTHTLIAIQRELLQHQQHKHLCLQRLINLNHRSNDESHQSRRKKSEKVATSITTETYFKTGHKNLNLTLLCICNSM
ncbi:hypothetical protein AMECASPLE_004383 [Ameca splendens]|uniref:Uncharacterized protein n=1 Tax=Ameca splendens TaxID=208324 RepID=A0ABV0XBV6_9TELE